MTRPRLELFYDIVSPYSYLAFECLLRYVEPWSLDLVLRPAFLGGVMKAVGNVPPATLPQRAPYLLRDVGRLSRYFDVEMAVPEDFPSNTLSTMRLLMATKLRHPALLSALSRELWRRHWGKGQAVNTVETLAPALAAIGATPAVADELLRAIGDDEVKTALKAAGDEAVARGAFGFPAMFVTIDGVDELYFGSDRISLLAHDLGLPWRGPQGRS